MTLQDLVARLMSHPLYQSGDAADVDVAVIRLATDDRGFIRPVANDLLVLTSQRTGRKRLALVVHQ